MGALETAFEERLQEVEAYLQFLEELEAAALTGSPRFTASGRALSVQQIEILRAGVFVQLYTLVEATMTRALDALADAAVAGGWRPSHLTPQFRSQWVKVVAAASVDMNAETRLAYAIDLAERLVREDALSAFRLDKGGGGNWEDKHIEKVLEKLGLRLRLTPTVRAAVKRPFRDDAGALGVVKKLRNDLAHGSISFQECGQSETAAVLRDLTRRTAMYLRSVVRAVERFIDEHAYLTPEHRP